MENHQNVKQNRFFYILLIYKIEIMILGVCEWISQKLGWNVAFIRIAFVLALLVYGTGLGLYLILWLVKIFSN